MCADSSMSHQDHHFVQIRFSMVQHGSASCQIFPNGIFVQNDDQIIISSLLISQPVDGISVLGKQFGSLMTK